MKVLGIKKVSYNRKSDGQHVEGVELHYGYPSKYIEGLGVETAFLGKSVLEDVGGELPAVGDEIELFYNKFGRVTGFCIK